ncbi:leucine-rich repeat domain-containing protein [Ruminococcus sp.]|uniref:leucine-rich repeat domain-containing protein n=1 Tax=Ruminococcus sp. TaxID=41978 RepID=UPI0025E626B8|nr:leucine-rich repeat domain-containing protein [Ruminococcus sp.]MBQ8967386.1 leucine-rich repeat domain-containing protein [Ruminococcus sp.]
MNEIDVACPLCGDVNRVDRGLAAAVCQSCGAAFAVPVMKEDYVPETEDSGLPPFSIRSGVLERYNGSDPVVYVPEGVTAIGGQAFKDRQGVHRVVLPEGVTEIQGAGGGMWGAFFGCCSLESIELPKSLTRIGANAFNGCSRLAKAIIPDGVSQIGAGAFNGCAELMEVKLPKALRELANDIFRGCTALTEIRLNGNIKTIGSYAFADCRELRALTIPPGVKTIGAYAFSGCFGLTELLLPGTVISLGASAFADCRNLSVMTVPASIEVFENDGSGIRTFAGCSQLRRVNLGKLPQDFMDIFATTPWLDEYLVKQGLCRHCGGHFKGVFSKVCVNCGLKKDY